MVQVSGPITVNLSKKILFEMIKVSDQIQSVWGTLVSVVVDDVRLFY